MVHFSAKPSFIYYLLLALFLSFGVSLYSARIVQVDDICSKHTNTASCVYILNSIPGTAAGVDPYTLSPDIINLAHIDSFNNLEEIHNLIQNTTNNPELKQHYASCSLDYNAVLLSLSQAQQSFSSGDYNGMNSNGATVMKDVQDCDSIPPSDPSSLPMNNSYLEDVTEIIMILADFLAGIY